MVSQLRGKKAKWLANWLAKLKIKHFCCVFFDCVIAIVQN